MEVNKIICGKCEIVLKDYPDNCIDTIITDPPYGLSFMGKKWDYDVPSVEIWRECLRVLKPGGTMLCFAGSRTQHRMAVNVEDAGFILKDCIMWLYGSGFPKASDISKNLDKMAKKERKVIGRYTDANGNEYKQTGKRKNFTSGNADEVENCKDDRFLITAPATPEAILWNGWKSHGLKPAYEPILVAMKPNEGSYANNALKYGVAGLDIDGGRISFKDKADEEESKGKNQHSKYPNSVMRNPAPNGIYHQDKRPATDYIAKGRYPANVILDEEAGRMLDEQSGESKSSNAIRKNNGKLDNKTFGKYNAIDTTGFNDKGGASRFFYCAKASKAERNRGCEGLENHNPCYESHRPNYKNTKGIETPYAGTGRSGNNLKNHHPTVKPLSLMKYLCTLTKTPTGGIVLDPFAGSGTTLMACKETGRDYIGIEREKEYIEIAERRIKAIPELLFV